MPLLTSTVARKKLDPCFYCSRGTYIIRLTKDKNNRKITDEILSRQELLWYIISGKSNTEYCYEIGVTAKGDAQFEYDTSRTDLSEVRFSL